MDENRLKDICSRNSFYLSLRDQENAAIGLQNALRSPRPGLSWHQTIRVHFAVHYGHHWAAVQLSISPFQLQAIPEQRFHRCHFRYSWCCETAQEADACLEVSTVVQRVYDFYYEPTHWNFSSQYCRSKDDGSCTDDVPCAKRIEIALIGYIGLENDADEQEIHLSGRDGNNNNVRFTKEIRERTRRNQIVCIRDKADDHDNDDDNTEDDNTAEQDELTSRSNDTEDDYTVEQNESTSHPSVRTLTEEDIAVENVTTKIRKALNEMFPTQQKTKQRGKNPPNCGEASSTGVNLHFLEVVPSDFKTHFLNGEFSIEDRLLRLETFLWQQSPNVVRGAKAIAWKCSLLAGCIRRLRYPSCDKKSGASNSTVSRWTIAAWMINSIVDGLWEDWGPRAALVYEALASKNYVMSRIVRLSENKLQGIIRRVIGNLKTLVLSIPSSTYVFHPAACLSSALDISYEETCSDLGLKKSFLKLGPPQAFLIHVPLSLLLDQWAPISAIQPVDNRHHWSWRTPTALHNNVDLDTAALSPEEGSDRSAPINLLYQAALSQLSGSFDTAITAEPARSPSAIQPTFLDQNQSQNCRQTTACEHAPPLTNSSMDWDSREDSRGSENETLGNPPKRRRVDSFSPSNENRRFIATPVLADVDLQAENVSSLESSAPQSSAGLIPDQRGSIEHDNQIKTIRKNIALMAEVGKLEGILGGILFEAMSKSWTRRQEESEGMMSFTNAVRLHFAFHEGEDFKLEVWLCSSIGETISQAKMRSLEDLRSIFGEYLFEAMKASNLSKGKEKENSECDGIIDVHVPNDGSDCKLEVILNFGTGREIYARTYLRVN